MAKLPRRSVLGAIGSIWSLSWTDQITLYLDERTSATSNSRDRSDQSYPRSEVIDGVFGSATAYHTAPHCAELKVGVYPHEPDPIGVELTTGAMNTAVSLDIDEAEQLAASLLESIDEIERWREEHDYVAPLDGFNRRG